VAELDTRVLKKKKKHENASLNPAARVELTPCYSTLRLSARKRETVPTTVFRLFENPFVKTYVRASESSCVTRKSKSIKSVAAAVETSRRIIPLENERRNSRPASPIPARSRPFTRAPPDHRKKPFSVQTRVILLA